MKIGILTFSPRRRYNHGSILQCLALQNTLTQMGHEVKVINFFGNHSVPFKNRLFIIYHMSLKEVFFRLKDYLLKGKSLPFKEEYNIYSKNFYQSHIHATKECNCESIGKVVNDEKLEAIVIGSDKIWGDVSNEQLVYFGEWNPKYSGKIISYAACSSQVSIPKFNRNKIKNLLSRFEGISVRDKYTLKLIQPFASTQVKIVADPTLLYNFDTFVSPYTGAPYVFVYILSKEIKGGHKQLINEIRKKVGNISIEAVVLPGESIDIKKYADNIIYDASPADWVNLLANASFIYTDSFHATLFAIKYHKPFITYYTEKHRASRLIDLSKEYNLDGYVVSSVNNAIDKNNIGKLLDYTVIDNKIKQQQEYSLSFIQKMLI